MKSRKLNFGLLIALLSLVCIQCNDDDDSYSIPTSLVIAPVTELSLDPTLVAQGRDVFRFNTYGDEAFWSGALQLDKAILGEEQGGFGPGLTPATALSLGVKVDVDALPQPILDAIAAGEVDLNSPATTVALLSLDAVLGVKGNFTEDGNLSSVGITCALCHSTVDDSFTQGIGSRIDGIPNRDVDVGTIISFADIQPLADLLGIDVATADAVLSSWGPGRFDGALLLDGQPANDEGVIQPATLIPAIYGLQDINPVSYTGFGDLESWTRFVAIVELGGQGNFSDPRLNSPQFPIAQASGAFNITVDEDLFEPVSNALNTYVLSLLPPQSNNFDETAAIRGQFLFNNDAQCINCHSGPSFADNILRTPEEIGIDDFTANRFPSGMYRTPPLRGVFAKAQGGYFHDGRFADLNEVVDHYDATFNLDLTEQDKNDLVQFLNAL
jgi:hypothetical protein